MTDKRRSFNIQKFHELWGEGRRADMIDLIDSSIDSEKRRFAVEQLKKVEHFSDGTLDVSQYQKGWDACADRISDKIDALISEIEKGGGVG